MAKIKDIALVDGFDWHGTQQMALPFREPSGRDVADLGEPRILVRTNNGYYYVKQVDTIKRILSAVRSTSPARMSSPC